MNPIKKVLMHITDKMENSCVLGAIRQGMIMMIPLLVVGYLSAMLVNLPISAYQSFMHHLLGGRVEDFFLCLYCCVNRFFSVFLAAAVSVGYSIMMRRKKGVNESTGSIIILVIITLAAFAGYSGIQYDDFSVDKFSNMHTFSALLVALISSVVYYALKGRGLFQMIGQHGMNTDSVYIAAIEGIGPAVIIIGFFSLLHQLFHVCFGVDGIQELMEQIFNYMLTPIKNGLGSGLIVIFLTHGLRFLGFHGHNMLDTVIKQHFTDVTAGIFSKTMQDVFVLLGGTGAMLCLVTAILLFARKKDVRHLAFMAAPTVIFNISEIALFGIPVIFNPIFLVPFILVPIANFLITYGAIYSGIVPHVVNEVDWTTPILLSGYQATGSWRGAVLQVVCLTAGVLIYRPFVRIYEEQSRLRIARDVKRLVEEMQREEENNSIGILTKREDNLGYVARVLASELAEAVRNKELFMMYQPQVNCDGECIGVEALIRWNSSALGFVNPADFIPLAEYLGLINPIGEYVMKNAALRCKYWNDMGHPEYHVNVNLSVVQLLQNDIVKKVAKVLEETRIIPQNLTLEVTESLAINDMVRMKKILSEIRNLGVRVALDDFGTGYSSLNHIREMPLDVIKIDRCFIEHLGEDDFSNAFVRMVSELANAINVRVCVEGVETKRQRDIVKKMGIRMIQGFFYGKPMKIEEFEKKYLI